VSPSHQPIRRGTAFVELLVIIAIIGMLIAILIPMFLSARQRSTRFKCQNNLRELGRAMYSYASANRGQFPSTRPSLEPNRRPDVSNSGHAATQPFGPQGPGPNNVPAAMFLLVRSGEVSAHRFICPTSTLAMVDRFDGLSPQERSNFSDVKRNITYGMHNPYASDAVLAAGFRWGPQWLPASFALMADIGPPAAGKSAKAANSHNHDGEGQNILYLDGSVEFRTTPLAGIESDHIYRTRLNSIFDSPQDPADSILLPIQQ
jgi:prepilin-type processing-associated H-X9-DG protein